MKIDFSATIKDFDGTDLKEAGDKPVTLGMIAVRALNANFTDEANLPAEEKVRRFGMALKISEGGEVDFKAEDIAEIKKVIGRAFNPLIVGRAFALLDG